ARGGGRRGAEPGPVVMPAPYRPLTGTSAGPGGAEPASTRLADSGPAGSGSVSSRSAAVRPASAGALPSRTAAIQLPSGKPLALIALHGPLAAAPLLPVGPPA